MLKLAIGVLTALQLWSVLSIARRAIGARVGDTLSRGPTHLRDNSGHVVVIARTLGRQLREVHGAVIKQELPPELQRVIDHLHEGAVKRPR